MTYSEPSGPGTAATVRPQRDPFVKVPGVARYLIEMLHLSDGGLELSRDPRVVTADRLPELVAVLRDQDRRSPVFVAGSDDRLPFGPFTNQVKDWTAQVDGRGHVFVLDPGATTELVTRLGWVWEAPAWTIRTYGPRLDLDQPATARQHRILSTSRLAQDSERYLQTLLGGFARNLINRHKTPSPLASWQRIFDRLENSALTEAMTSAPTPRPTVEQPPRPTAPAPVTTDRDIVAPDPVPRTPPLTEDVVDTQAPVDVDVTAYLTELERVRTTLGLPDLEEETLRRFAEQATAPRTDPHAIAAAASRIERQQARIEALAEELEQVKDQLLAEQVEHLATQEEQQRLADRAAWLSQQLVSAGEAGAAYAPLPEDVETTYPSSYGELLERASELEALGVVITADVGTVLELDTVDSSGKALRNAWDSMLVLGDYVRAQKAGECSGNVHQYLCITPPGYRPMSPGKHAWNETCTTMNQYGDERRLPVPVEVSRTGFAEMRAHVKLGRIGMSSQRLHYLDDVAGTGKVYVGYIGTHLTNTKTN